MKIAVIGAGAVGCYYGGMLARAGYEVVLIGRAQHVEAIQRHGLKMETQHFNERVRVPASTQMSAVADATGVLFCVKSADTVSAASELKHHLSSAAWLLSLQNGVENVERLRGLLPQQVVAAAVYVAAEMVNPGHVKHHGGGELIVEASHGSDDRTQMFASAGVPCRITDNICGELWSKLIINCTYNALSAITHLPYGQLAQNRHFPGIMQDIVTECLAVAETEGVIIPGAGLEAVQRILTSACGIAEAMPTQYSSTAKDLSRGRPTEIDYLNGFMVRRGEALGVATPVNRLLYGLVTLLESKIH